MENNINEDIVSKPDTPNEEHVDSQALSQIKRELYDIFIECSVGANSRFEQIKIDKLISRVADAWGVDISKIKEELDLGFAIEKEHSQENKLIRQVIALQHIIEDVSYYTNNKPENWASIEVGAETVDNDEFNPFKNEARVLSLFNNRGGK